MCVAFYEYCLRESGDASCRSNEGLSPLDEVPHERATNITFNVIEEFVIDSNTDLVSELVIASYIAGYFKWSHV